MKLNRFLCLVLAMLLLLADSGQLLSAHTCIKSGRTSLSLQNGSDCCKVDADAYKIISFKRTGCCQVNSKYVKQTVAGKIQLTPIYNFTAFAFVVNDFFQPFATAPVVSTNISAPSTLPDKNDLSFIGVYRC